MPQVSTLNEILQSQTVWNRFRPIKHYKTAISSQIIATSHNLTPKSGAVKHHPSFKTKIQVRKLQHTLCTNYSTPFKVNSAKKEHFLPNGH